MRPFRTLALLLVLIVAVIGSAAVFKERIAEGLAKRYLGVDAIAIQQISIGGDLSVAVSGLDVTFNGQRVEFAHIDVGRLTSEQIAGHQSARVKGRGVRLHFVPAFGARGEASAPPEFKLPIPENFAMPHLELQDVRGAIKWEEQTFNILLSSFQMAPGDKLSRATFKAQIDVQNVAQLNLEGEVSPNRISIHVLPMQVSFEDLAKVGGVDGVKGGKGIVELRVEQNSLGLSVTGRTAVQGLTLPGPDGGVDIVSAKAEFGTPDPAKGIRARGSVVVAGLPKIDFLGGVSASGMDVTFDVPKVDPKRIVLLAAMKDKLRGVGRLKGRVKGPFHAPDVTWEFVSNGLEYRDLSIFRRPLSLGAAQGRFKLGAAGLRRAEIEAEVDGIPFALKFSASASGRKQKIDVRLTAEKALTAFRNLIPVRLMGPAAGDVLRQMRQGKVASFTASAMCKRVLTACLEKTEFWKVEQGQAVLHGLNISPLPRSPSMRVSKAVLDLTPDKSVLTFSSDATKIQSGQISAGTIELTGTPLAPPKRIKGQVTAAITFAEIAQIVTDQSQAVRQLGLQVTSGTAQGTVIFETNDKAEFHMLRADATLQNGAGDIRDLGAFKKLNATIKGALNKDGSIPIEISSMRVEGPDWNFAANGTTRLVGEKIIPNLALKAVAAPAIVNRFIGDTAGFTWSGGAVNLKAQLSGDSTTAFALIGDFDGARACLRYDSTIIKACKEKLTATGRLDLQVSNGDAAFKLSGLHLGKRHILKSASARRRDGKWLLALQSTPLSWPWLAGRAGLTLPKGAIGNVTFTAQLQGKDLLARLKAEKATLPTGFGATGSLSGAVNLRGDIVDVAGEVFLESPRKIHGEISGSVKDIFSNAPQVLMKITAPHVDLRANWHEKVSKSEGAFTIATLNEWLKDLPFPKLFGRGRVTFSFPDLKVGQAKGDEIDGAGRFTWAPLSQRLDVSITRKKEPIGLFRITGEREDELQPMAMVGTFAVDKLPITLIGSWLGQPDLFAKGVGSARGRIRSRWGWELPLWRGKFEIAAKDVQLGTSKLGAELLTQAGLPEEARALTDDGRGIVAKEIRFLGRFRRENLEVNPLFMNSSAFDVFAQGKVDLHGGGLDGTIAFKPLQDAAGAISKIPLLGYLITGKSKSLVEFTWKLGGSLDDPALSKSAEVDTTKGLFGAMKRFHELPSLLFAPIDDD